MPREQHHISVMGNDADARSVLRSILGFASLHAQLLLSVVRVGNREPLLRGRGGQYLKILGLLHRHQRVRQG